MELKQFFHMGGYAFYVWTSFGVTALVMALTWWSARRRKRAGLVIARRRAAGGAQ